MTDFTFLIGKYTEDGLEKELAGLLAAAQIKAAPKDDKKKRMAVILPAVMAAVGVYLIIAGVRRVNTLFLVVGVLAIAGGAYYLWSSRSAQAQRPVARRLLSSLNAIESSNKAAVLFSEDGLTIRAKNNEASITYADISAAAESKRLYALLHQGAVTVLQKKDLVGKTPADFSAYLAEKTAQRYLKLEK